MPNIYYKIQYKTELEALNLELRKSTCKGLFIPINLFYKKNQSEGSRGVNYDFFETIKSFNKKLILYKNFQSIRPSLVDPKNYTDEKSRQSAIKKFQQFEENNNPKSIEELFIKDISDFVEIREWVNKNSRTKEKSILENKLFRKKSNFGVLNYTIPYIPLVPSKLKRKNDFLKRLSELTQKRYDILDDITMKYFDKYDLTNQIYIISIMLEEHIENPEIINKLIEKAKKFNNIGLWIIDFNELSDNTTLSKINKYKEIITRLNNLGKNLTIFYSGFYTTRLIQNINPNINNLVRIGGYPGLNINIPAIVQRTKRFYNNLNGLIYNSSNLAQDFIKSTCTYEYNCACPICRKNRINSFKDVLKFYIDSPTSDNRYNNYVGRAVKTKEKKLKAKQSVFLKIHNFFNVDSQLNSSYKDFLQILENRDIAKSIWIKKFEEEVSN